MALLLGDVGEEFPQALMDIIKRKIHLPFLLPIHYPRRDLRNLSALLPIGLLHVPPGLPLDLHSGIERVQVRMQRIRVELLDSLALRDCLNGLPPV